MSFSSSQMPHTSPPSSSLPPPLPPGTPNNNTPPPPQPPTTPRTLHSEDPEVATPHEGPYPSHQHHETDKPVASPTTSSSPPPPPVPSLRADWLAARAPEYYQRAPPADGPEVYYYGDGERGRAAGEGKERERVCGLRPVVFWIMVILLVLVLGGATGGGVGGGLAAAAAAKESSPTTTSNSASSSTTTLNSSTSPTPTGQDSANCPSRTGQTYTTTNGSLTFLQLCGINICPETCDIVSASKQRLDTFEECMDACAIYNRQIGTQKCVAVAWDYQQVRQSFDNLCWLKLSQAPLVQDDPADGLTVGAVVIQS